MTDYTSATPQTSTTLDGNAAFADAVQRARAIAAKIGGSSTIGLNSGSSTSEASGLPSAGGLGTLSGGDAGSGIKRPLEDTVSDSEPATKNLAMQNDNDFDTFASTLTGMPRAAPASNMNHGSVNEEYFVPNKLVGLIIGRGGQQISALQADSGCNIQIAPDSGGAATRQVTLTGTPESVKHAKSLIDDIVTKAQQNEQEGNVTFDMMIPATKVGLVIGKGGDTIRQLQEQAQVRMVMIQEGPNNTGMDKPLRITGDASKVENAKRLIQEVMDNARNNSGGDNFFNNRGQTQEVVVPKHAVGMVIGRGGDMIKRIQEQTKARVQFKPGDRDAPERIALISGSSENIQMAVNMVNDLVANARDMGMDGGPGPGGMGGPGGPWMRGRGRGRGGGPPFGRGGGGGGGGGGGRDFGGPGGMGGPMGRGEPSEHSVPASKCGLVIGRGGESIRGIIQQSGAHVEISHGQHPPGQKIFLVSGDPDQVEYARSLIDEKVNGGPGPGGPGSGGPGGPGGGPGGPGGPPGHRGGYNGPPSGPQQPPVPQGYNNQQGWNAYSQWQQPQQPQQQPQQQQPQQQAPDTSGYGDSNPYAAYYQYYQQAAAQQQQQQATSQPASTVQTTPSTSAPQSTDAQAQPGQANNQAANQDLLRQWADYYRAQAGQGAQDYSQQWMEYFQHQALYMSQQNQGQTPAQGQ